MPEDLDSSPAAKSEASFGYGRFPEDADVKVRFPLTEEQRHGDFGEMVLVHRFSVGE